MTKLIAVLGALAIGLVIVASAEAKGPMSMKITGPGLAEPVAVAGLVDMPDMYPEVQPQGVDPALVKGETPFVLSFTAEDPGTGEEFFIFALEYYQETSDHPATLSNPDGRFVAPELFWEAPATIREKVEAAGVLTANADSGESTSLWYLLPGVLVGLVVAGGLGGRYLMSGRES